MAVNPTYLAEASKCVECMSPNQKENATVYLLDNIALNLASGGGIHELLSPSHPDTAPSFVLRGSLIVGDSTPLWTQFPIGEGDTVLRSNGSDPIWAKLALNTDVVGTLAVVNGGTNSSTALNNNRLMVSSGGAIVEAAALTNGQLLIGSTGAAPVAASLIAGANITITPGAGSITIAAATPIGTHSILDAAVHTDSVSQAVTRGSLIYGNSTPKWDRLTIGVAGTVLTSDGTDVSWSTPASAGTVTSFSAGNLAPLFTTNVATASTTPALTFSLSTQAANLVFAGPASGAAAGPTFRSLAALDLPATAVVPATYGSATQVGQFTVDQQGRITSATDVAIAFPGGISGFANPTALVGLVAVNGVATTAIRSDGAPALDQSIVPTWTGAHTWTPSANTTPITVSGYSLTVANAQSALDLSGTWNTTGDPSAIKLNITNTASGIFAYLMNLQKDGVSRCVVRKDGTIELTRQEPDISQGGMEMIKRGTTGNATAALSSSSGIASLGWQGWDGTAFGQAGSIRIFTTQAWSVGAHGTRMYFSTVPSGSATVTQHATLDSNALTLLNGSGLIVGGVQGAISINPFNTSAGNTGEVRYYELVANGFNYTGFKAPDSIAASQIYVLPNAAPAANRFLQAAAVVGGVSALSWAQASLTADVSGTLPVGNGGTGITVGISGGVLGFTSTTTIASSVLLTANALVLGGGAGVTPVPMASLGTTTTVLHGNAAGAPTFSAVSLTADVSGILPVANGGSGTSTAFTAGSVIFAGVAGVYAQDNANFFWDDANNRLGIGKNASLLAKFTVQNTVTSAIVEFGSVSEVDLTTTTGAFDNTVGLAGTVRLRGSLGGSGFKGFSGLNATAFYYNTGTTSYGQGFFNDVRNLGAGTVVMFSAIRASQILNSGGGSITKAAGLRIEDQTDGASNYGIYSLVSAGAASWNLYVEGAAQNYLQGSTGIGVVTPLAKFHVVNSAAATVATIIQAAASQSADLTQWQNSSATPLVVVDAAGRVGIGKTTSLLALLSVFPTVTATTAQYGVLATLDMTLSSGNVAESIGAAVGILFRGSGGNIAGVKGISALVGSAYCYNTGTVDYMQGFYNDIRNLGTGTVTHLSAVRCGIIQNLGGGVITNAYGLKAENQNAGTNNYGVHSNVTIGATSWNFYAATNAKNYFGGPTGIAVTSPTAYLHLAAGTSSVNSAPFKFTSGVSNATAEVGAMEFTTDDLFFTITTGAARKRLLMADATAGLTATRVSFATTNGRLTDDAGMTFGAATLTVPALTIGAAGVLQLGNTAALGAALVSTHTMTIKDTTGTTYRVMCLV